MKAPKFNKKRFEIIIVIFLVSLVWYYGFDSYKKMLIRTKEVSLAMELKIIRQSVYIYVIKYHKYPDNLKELEKKKIIIFNEKFESQKYIKNKRALENGILLDPFGNPYIYNNKNGDVKSSTKNYINE
ncbi:MAG: hypothetical protein GX287_00300 [Fusobacteria bacterium]|jgi:hypothetical protein|nr:hypothetical protein [Fusobacteriota bacterium]